MDKDEKPPEPYPKVVYQLGTDSKEYFELKEAYDKLISDFVEKLKNLPNWSTTYNTFLVNWKDITEVIEEYEGKQK